MPLNLNEPISLLDSAGGLFQLAVPLATVTQLRTSGWVDDVTERVLPDYDPTIPGDAMNRLDFTLTQAQVQALHTTPVQIIPAPGVGSGIVPMFIAIYKAGATAYGGGGAVNFAYNNGMSGSVDFVVSGFDPTGLLTASGLRYVSGNFVLSLAGSAPLSSDVDNKPLFIYSTVALTGSGGVVKGTIFYSIVAIS